MIAILSSLGRSFAIIAGAAAVLAACSYSGEDLDRPLTQRFFWTSVVNADDLRSACIAGQPPRWRAVYNGSYEEQLRVYDLVGSADGGARLEAQAQETANLARIELSRPLAPWQWQRSETTVSAAELSEFERALRSDGFEAEPPVGARLDSRGFYWVVTGCRDGEVDFQVWRDPQDAPLVELAFVRWLSARDTTGMALARPHPVDRLDPSYDSNRVGGGGGLAFTFTVRDNGLRGPGSI